MKKRRKVLLYAGCVMVAFLAGGGFALLYVYAHPIRVFTQCMFTLPRSFTLPLET